ncbi:MAG: N-acetylmuramoyl-L-alanine amidase, partial [Duncaniella sp.]|nr:N-acetylmuramoyl-L-alanine amidase [Duncaniella sp.]
ARRERETVQTVADTERKTRTEISPTKGQIIYKIQFLTSPTKLRNKDSRLKGLSPVDFYKDGKSFKYTYGTYRTQPDAASDLKRIKKLFPDAFIIRTRDGKRIK